MTKKDQKQKNLHNSDEPLESPVEALETEKGSEESQDADQANTEEIQALKEKLEEAEAKISENLDGWQRAQAEFINYKKRVERDREMEHATMKGDILKKLLPVLDDLELALANRPDEDSWAQGVELVARKFHSILEAEGVVRIDAAGELFDPNFHEAISSEPNEEVESGYVIEVVKNGYMLGERVIRPSVVRVAQ